MFSYETVVSILHTSGSSDAGHPSADHFPDNKAHEVDTETLSSYETAVEPLSTTDVDVPSPKVFSDSAESQTEQEVSKTEVFAKTDATQGLSLVASLRLAAIEQEKVREQEMLRKEREEAEKKEKERIEKEEIERIERDEAEKKEKYKLEREEAEKKERERLEKDEEIEREKENESQKEQLERIEGEKKQKEQLEREEESKRMEKTQEELEKKEKAEVKQEIDKKKEKKENRIKGKEEKDGTVERIGKKQTPTFFSFAQINQKETSSQSDHWPPLREAELDDIAYDDRLQDESRRSDPAAAIPPNTEARLASARPSDSVASSKAINDKPKDSASAALRSAGSRLKHDAIPVWLREEEEEEVKYERGQEDLGSVWLSELYMEGEAG